MKSGLRAIVNVAGLALCLAFGIVAIAQTQNREKYVISAKAGGINLVAGEATVRRAGARGEQLLAAQDDLASGDTVLTGAGGRVEVLLNPGSYMRVSENSEVELTDASLDTLLVNLRKGSAIVEVASADDVETSINIVTPQSNVLIVRGGIYRFNVLPGNATEIFVRKGRLLLDRDEKNRIKGGQKVVVRSGRVEVAKFDKKEQDELDLWSKDRAKMLARANAQLQARSLIAAFRNLNPWDSMGIFSAANNGTGTWIYNPRASSYCFYPVGGRVWSSPYGHSYTNGGGWWPGANPGNGYPRTGGGSGGWTGSGGGNAGGSNPSAPTPATPPQMPASPAPMPSSPPMQPSSPMREMPRESPREAGPRREYTTQP